MKYMLVLLSILSTFLFSETINGYELPPEPDPKINNSTLLGIDSNNNGVRDDVERKIYATYPKAIQRAVMMQAFRAKQKMLADPDFIANAKIWAEKTWKAFSCKNYLFDNNKMPYIKSREISKFTEDNQFNTEERMKFYIEYNKALSGGVYSIKDGTLQDCEFDIDKVLEMDKLSTTTKLPETINGHNLPPEPDPKINNSTLLGIDSNNNGVRDDVERWIYHTYTTPIERGLLMQFSRAYQKVIVVPSQALKTKRYINNASSCEFYFLENNKNFANKYEYVYFTKKMRRVQFNTLKRHIAYEKYQGYLSGGVYPLSPALQDRCEFDENGILSDIK